MTGKGLNRPGAIRATLAKAGMLGYYSNTKGRKL